MYNNQPQQQQMYLADIMIDLPEKLAAVDLQHCHAPSINCGQVVVPNRRRRTSRLDWNNADIHFAFGVVGLVALMVLWDSIYCDDEKDLETPY